MCWVGFFPVCKCTICMPAAFRGQNDSGSSEVELEGLWVATLVVGREGGNRQLVLISTEPSPLLLVGILLKSVPGSRVEVEGKGDWMSIYWALWCGKKNGASNLLEHQRPSWCGWGGDRKEHSTMVRVKSYTSEHTPRWDCLLYSKIK